jgi:hypothetical protein
MNEGAGTTQAMTNAKPTLGKRLERLLAEYGSVALVVYFAIFGATLLGFAAAISLGFDVQSSAGTAGTWGAAYVATKLSQPLRILATLAVVPLVVRIRRRRDIGGG